MSRVPSEPALLTRVLSSFLRERRARRGPPPLVDGIYRIPLTTIEGAAFDSETLRGRVLLIVNTASRCGFTPQLEALERLHEEFRSQGLTVLGFPSGDFRNQELASDSEIRTFCTSEYGLTFPLFSKGHVTGPSRQPFFESLLASDLERRRGDICWNFEKFLVNRKGYLIGRWRSWVSPVSWRIRSAIAEALNEI